MKIALCKASVYDTKISEDRPHLTGANTSLFPDWLKSNGVRQDNDLLIQCLLK